MDGGLMNNHYKNNELENKDNVKSVDSTVSKYRIDSM